jgi:hypothetical protein
MYIWENNAMKFNLLFIASFLSIVVIGQVDLSSKESMSSWVSSHEFKASVEGDFDMYISIENLNNQETLVLSNKEGKRKVFTNLNYQPGGSAATLTCLGVSNNSLEIVFSPEGNLITEGMTFVPVSQE